MFLMDWADIWYVEIGAHVEGLKSFLVDSNFSAVIMR